MNDTDDFEMDDLEAIDEVENDPAEKKVTIRRDVRVEIEKRLEQIELSKLMGDSVYDEVFD